MRRAARDTYDLEILLVPGKGPCEQALVLLKRTWDLAQGRPVPGPAEVLAGDPRSPELQGRMPAGSDYWPRKAATDVVVSGSAISRRPTAVMDVVVRVGDLEKRARVFGRRLVEWRDGRPRVGAAEPFEALPLTFFEAYGGIDGRVPRPEPTTPAEVLAAETDHPGLYPRNPFGKGYLVGDAPVEDAEMPRVEDPSDLLDADRLLVRDPSQWYRQPIPWGFEFVHAMTFPRYAFALGGADAMFPAPEDRALPEVARGFLPSGYRTSARAYFREHYVHPRFAQEASHGLVFERLAPGTPLLARGMSELETVESPLPAEPRLEALVDGRREVLAPRLHTVHFRPTERTLTTLHAADVALGRTFVPGVHKYIPIAVSVDGDAPVVFEPPPTLRDRLAKERGA